MTERKLIMYSVLMMVLLCTVHFFSQVWVYAPAQSRSVEQVDLTASGIKPPYDAGQLQARLQGWALPVVAPAKATEPKEQALTGFDSGRLGNTTIALLAIYQKQQSVAVLAISTADTSLQFVRLQQGQLIDDIELFSVSAREVVLRLREQELTLRLFNPIPAAAN